MKQPISVLSSAALVCLLSFVGQVWSLPLTTANNDAESTTDASAQAEDDNIALGWPRFLRPKSDRLELLKVHYPDPEAAGAVVTVSIDLTPEASDPGGYTGYFTFPDNGSGRGLDLDGVTFTGGPSESILTTKCQFIHLSRDDDGAQVVRTSGLFGRDEIGWANDVDGIGCAARPVGLVA